MSTGRGLSRIGGGRGGSQLLSGRRGSVLVAGVSAALAAILIYLFVSHYRTQQTTVAAPATQIVFIAKQYIPAGTPYSVLTSDDMLERKVVPSSQAVIGAIADPSAVQGQASTVAVAAGAQVTSLDFSASAKPALPAYLKGDYRAVALSLDAAHGLTAYVKAGDYVDVIGQEGHGSGKTTEMLAQKVEVLANANGQVVLRLTDKQALAMIAATGPDSLWLALRGDHHVTQTVKVGTTETL